MDEKDEDELNKIDSELEDNYFEGYL